MTVQAIQWQSNFSFSRMALFAFAAASITFALFAVMQLLISNDQKAVAEPKHQPVVDVVYQEFETPVEERKPLPPPPKMQQQPKVRAIPQVVNEQPGLDMEGFESVVVDPGIAPEVIGLGQSDNQLTPMVRIAPAYPLKALQDGVEGWVKLSFDIDISGRVDNIRVEDAQPKRVFNREARKALSRWRYKPQVENGRAMAVLGQTVVLTFNLEQ